MRRTPVSISFGSGNIGIRHQFFSWISMNWAVNTGVSAAKYLNKSIHKNDTFHTADTVGWLAPKVDIPHRIPLSVMSDNQLLRGVAYKLDSSPEDLKRKLREAKELVYPTDDSYVLHRNSAVGGTRRKRRRKRKSRKHR
jgi:hypothetical protein